MGVFDHVDNAELAEVVFEPIVPLIRGKSPEVKRRVYASLPSPSFQALFMIQVWASHARLSAAEWYWWSVFYYRQPEAWQALQDALRFFSEEELALLVSEFVSLPVVASRKETSVSDLEHDPSLAAAVHRYYDEFIRLLPSAMIRIGAWIRSRPEEFQLPDSLA